MLGGTSSSHVVPETTANAKVRWHGSFQKGRRWTRVRNWKKLICDAED